MSLYVSVYMCKFTCTELHMKIFYMIFINAISQIHAICYKWNWSLVIRSHKFHCNRHCNKCFRNCWKWFNHQTRADFFENLSIFLLIDEDISANLTSFECMFGALLCSLIYKHPSSRNCAARQRAMQIILDLAEKSSKINIII